MLWARVQDRLPKAAVVYSSATGVSEPRNMAYMMRLGDFGYGHMSGLVRMMDEQKEQLAVSELFACGLKSAGMYMARCARPMPSEPICHASRQSAECSCWTAAVIVRSHVYCSFWLCTLAG